MKASSDEKTGIRLLKKGQKGLVHALFSRLGLIVILLILQVLFFFEMLYRFYEFYPHVVGATSIFIAAITLYLINSRIDPTAKITWLVLISLVPLIGAPLLLYTQLNFGHRAIKKRLTDLNRQNRARLVQSKEVLQRLKEEDPDMASMAHYVARTGCFPVYDKTQVTYFPLGEKKFEALLAELKNARQFIFLEYFIIDEGVMWGKILEILAQKVQEGVEVRVMFDGTCEFSTLPHDYPKRLKKMGIQCKMFAPLTPLLSTHYNYRDHRKILVIDSLTAFTGGVNLADEYINLYPKHGHWKDTAIMLKGDAVPSFTLMFLEMWAIDEKKPEFDKYLHPSAPSDFKNTSGYVLPYGDSPLDEDKVGERFYMNLLNQAKRYVHIMSPYLILDQTMETALKFAAERGIEVKLILPGIPDKIAPYALAKTHYAALLDAGVEIYEYTPGFVHAKVFVSDDSKAIVGTINLDYRSLVHHFECAALLKDTECIGDIENDFQNTLQKCRKVSRQSLREEKLSLRLLGMIMKIIAPLM